MASEHLCPACGASLDFAPWEGDSPSDEICPCCGIQFGYTDFAGGDFERRLVVYERWRIRWVEEGAHWRHTRKPENWSAVEQLRRIGVEIELATGSR
jgi:hypothetical protein